MQNEEQVDIWSVHDKVAVWGEIPTSCRSKYYPWRWALIISDADSGLLRLLTVLGPVVAGPNKAERGPRGLGILAVLGKDTGSDRRRFQVTVEALVLR